MQIIFAGPVLGKFGRIVLYIFLAGLGLAIGAYTAWTGAAKIPSKETGQRVTVGQWSSDYSIGTTATDPKTRAMIARRGIMALPRSEAVYFTTTQDADGDVLRDSCTYELSGQNDMGALWWSITLYDEADFLPKMAGNYSINSDQFGAADNFNIGISKDGDLSHRDAGNFDLTLRLYKPQDWVISEPSRLSLPTVKRLSCEDAS